VYSPSNDPGLQISTGTAQQSPFVIAFQRSGIRVLPSIINAVVCTSAISSGSACIFIASRTLYGLSMDGHAPRIMQRCNRLGVPWVAITTTCIFFPLVYLNEANNTSVVFGWFVNITTVAGLIGWIVIEGTYLRFYYGLKAQGYSRDALPYKSPLQPFTAWATLFMVSCIVFFSGTSTSLPFRVQNANGLIRFRRLHNRQFHGGWVLDFLFEYFHLHWSVATLIANPDLALQANPPCRTLYNL
jgi:amino acid transporter